MYYNIRNVSSVSVQAVNKIPFRKKKKTTKENKGMLFRFFAPASPQVCFSSRTRFTLN